MAENLVVRELLKFWLLLAINQLLGMQGRVLGSHRVSNVSAVGMRIELTAKNNRYQMKFEFPLDFFPRLSSLPFTVSGLSSPFLSHACVRQVSTLKKAEESAEVNTQHSAETRGKGKKKD